MWEITFVMLVVVVLMACFRMVHIGMIADGFKAVTVIRVIV